MTKIKYDITLMKYISVFESITRAKIKDCFLRGETVFFIVEQGQIAKAIGKNGTNVKMLNKALNRKIKIVEFSPSVSQFIKNLVYPLKIKEISEEEGLINVIPEDGSSRSLLIGREARNLRNTEEIVGRYFEINEIKVL